jgi:hypothetical protein
MPVDRRAITASASPVTFALGPDGKAASITVGFLDRNGLGTLKRAGE